MTYGKGKGKKDLAEREERRKERSDAYFMDHITELTQELEDNRLELAQYKAALRAEQIMSLNCKALLENRDKALARYRFISWLLIGVVIGLIGIR